MSDSYEASSPDAGGRGLSRRSLLTAAALGLPAAVAFGTALGPAAPASATTTGSAQFITLTNGAWSGVLTFSNVPPTARPIGGYGLFLDGTTLWYGDTVHATGVTSARGNRNDVWDFFSYVQNGVATSVRGSNGTVSDIKTWPQVPATAVPVGAFGAFLDNGDLWYFGSIVATGVTQATGLSGAVGKAAPGAWTDWIGFFDNAARTFKGVNGTPAQWKGWFNVPASAQITRMPGQWLDGNGDLWFGNLRRAYNVLSASGTLTDDPNWAIGSYVANGKAYKDATSYMVRGDLANNPALFPSVPKTARPIGALGVFLDGTNLWSRRSIIATNVVAAVGDSTLSTDHISLVTSA